MVFMGTPEFAVPSLREVAGRCEVVAVVTAPDRPRGRGRRASPSPVAEAAEALGLRVLKVDDANAAPCRRELAGLCPDLFAVVAFGTILGAELLATPRLGCINLHGSLLPEYRGASPVQRALWDGRSGTGVTTLWMDEGVDTGDCVLQRWAAIEPADDAGALAARLAGLGAPLLAETLLLAHAGRAPRHPQPRAAGSYAAKLVKRDGAVAWAADPVTVWNRQRAVTPWPGAVTGFRGRRLLLVRTWPRHRLPVSAPPGHVLEVAPDGVAVACAGGALLLTRVRPEGRADMDAADWARGARLAPGAVLEHEEEALA